MINNNNSILLIDEIENGIHYKNQLDLWKMLFKISAEFNIQIFATTHSYEMLKSFSKASEMNDDAGAYFEITKDVRADQFVAVKRTVFARRTKTGIKPMFENEFEAIASDIGSQMIVVRRANIRFAPTL